MSHLRFGDTPIRSTYLLDEADYIACHNQSYVYKYDLLKGLRERWNFRIKYYMGRRRIRRTFTS